MKITGTSTLDAAPDAVWRAILDPAAALTERYGTHFYTAEVVGESLLPERRFRRVNLRKEGAS